MSRKLLALTMLLALLVGLMPGTSLAQEPVTLKYATFTGSGDRAEELDQIIQAFQAENPHITIEVISAPFDDYFTMLQADFVAGEPPDVLELNYENFVAYAASGVLLDVSEYLDPETPYYPGALNAFKYQGAQMALPETFSTVVLYYNKDLFDQAGVAYPTADWTWDDALAAAEQIRALDDDIWGIYAPIQFWEFYKRAAQNGCSFFNEDMTESTINAPECVEALDVMMRFIETDVMPDPAESAGIPDTEMFQNGSVGMVVLGIWMFPAYADLPFEWDIELEPGIAQKAYHFFSNGVAIARDTEHPEEAALWAQFLTASETAATVRVENDWELPAINKPEYFEAFLSATPPANREVVFASLEAPVPPPVIERQSEMQDIFEDLLAAVVNGELDSQTALDMAKAEIDALLQ
jgi:multiple sugar transport system substrate-binding protein